MLDVRIQGHSIHDVLQWTVDEAIARFRHQPKLGAALWQLQQVGLGYLRLGQPATTLSGGEAQRLKIARELIQAGKREGRKLYILDEPTTGLHLDDVRVLIQVLDRLVDAGHTVVVIEHHLDVIKRADWVDRSGAGGRRRRRPRGRSGHARGDRRDASRIPHGPISAPAAPTAHALAGYCTSGASRADCRPGILALFRAPGSSVQRLPKQPPRLLDVPPLGGPLAHHQPDRVAPAEPGVGEEAPGRSRSPASSRRAIEVDPARARSDARGGSESTPGRTAPAPSRSKSGSAGSSPRQLPRPAPRAARIIA